MPAPAPAPGSLAGLAAALSECPPPPEPTILVRQLGWDLRLELPSGWTAGDELVLELRPGILTPGPDDDVEGFAWGHCSLVSGRTDRQDETSATAELVSSPGCVPAPEPPSGSLLAAGLVGLALVARRRRGPRGSRLRR